MTDRKPDHFFRAVFSLEPLLSYWKENVVPVCDHMANMYQEFEDRINNTPELKGRIEDVSILEQHHDLLMPLMSIVFPTSSWETDVSGALTSFTLQPVYVSPEFKRLLVGEDGSLKGRVKDDEGTSGGSVLTAYLLRAYFLILEKVYGIHQTIETPIIRIVKDQETGLDRYFRITPDLRFTEVRTAGEPRDLTEEDRKTITQNIADPEVLSKFIPSENFEFQGFTVIRAVEVTQSEVISELEKDLIDKESIFSADGLHRVQERLRILFGRPGLKAWMGAIMGDQVLVINDDCDSSTDCIFTNSHHISLDDIKGSMWLRAVERGSDIVIPDLHTESNLTFTEQQLLSKGARSMIVSPLYYQGEIIGTLDIVSPDPNDLGPFDTMLTKQIAPLFSVALKRGLDEMDSEVESIIKEKCTAVHPSVEWRFRKAAFHYMDHLRIGQPVDMEQIVFKSVRPFFAQSDIRGSSDARNRGVQADLMEQLTLAQNIMKWAGEAKSWPLLQELMYQIEKQVENVQFGLATGDEESVTDFLQHEIEPAFDELRKIGPGVIRAVEKYQKAMDPTLGVIYRKRREFEDSISILNEALSSYLDREEAEAQAVFPHYFEKHQTDGIDYMIYMGASMIEEGKLNPFYVKNLALWQLIVACGMAWHTNRIKPELKVPLDTCHLILVNHSPLSIRFRYDEKRFDVDGAYDIRHEIIKSRIDKAEVKGNGERLTQPDRIAIVYSHPEEKLEVQRHIEFLQAKGTLMDDLEFLDVEDLSGVKGLQALRVGINLQEQAKERIGEYMANIS